MRRQTDEAGARNEVALVFWEGAQLGRRDGKIRGLDADSEGDAHAPFRLPPPVALRRLTFIHYCADPSEARPAVVNLVPGSALSTDRSLQLGRRYSHSMVWLLMGYSKAGSEASWLAVRNAQSLRRCSVLAFHSSQGPEPVATSLTLLVSTLIYIVESASLLTALPDVSAFHCLFQRALART